VARAGTAPPPQTTGAPLSILVDFDGTISRGDVTDALLAAHATDPAWRSRDDAYVAGRVGSRALLAWDATILEQDRAKLEATARLQPADPTFARFVAAVRDLGAAVEVVSDGLGFYVEPYLDRLGVGDLPVATSRLDFSARPFRLEFPFGHPACFVCGTCKRERVRAHQEAGRFVAFVGDGDSDRYGAWQADLVFAKDRLARLCEAEGWPYLRWERFADVGDAIDHALRDGTVPRTVERLRRLRGAGPTKRFICGPEVWGGGRTSPGP
jgi:2-hydroxy-3-keto-5-methylthiopentenyl-1-phosphate phosphatase